MGFPWQKYWSGLPFPSPVGLPKSRIKPASTVLAGRFFTTEALGKSFKVVEGYKETDVRENVKS